MARQNRLVHFLLVVLYSTKLLTQNLVQDADEIQCSTSSVVYLANAALRAILLLARLKIVVELTVPECSM